MNTIITAERFLADAGMSWWFPNKEAILQEMVRFARSHVEAALKNAETIHYKIRTFPAEFEELQGFHSLPENLNLEKKLILSSYPLENIKES